MDEKIKNLWNNNKLLFFILLPLVLLFVFRDLVLSLLIGSARRVTGAAKAEDEKLKSESSQIEREADKTKVEADEISKRIENRKEDDISEDWNKKK